MLRTAIACLVVTSCLFAQVEEKAKPEWMVDYDKALVVAKESGKDLLVQFTGSDWCPPCMRLKANVFSKAPFAEKASETYVLVLLDFPNGEEAKAKVPSPERNQALTEKFGITGFPTVLLVNSEEIVFGRTGYQEGGPEDYLKHLAELNQKGKSALKEIAALEAELATAETEEAKAAVRERAVKALVAMDAETPGVQKVIPLVKEALPSLKGELRVQAVKGLLVVGAGDDAMLTEARTLDPKNEHGLIELIAAAAMTKVTSDETARAFLKELDALVSLEIKDKERFKGMVINAAAWSHGPLADKAYAEKYAKILKPMAEGNEELMGLVNSILKPESR